MGLWGYWGYGAVGYSGQISHHFRRLRALLSSRRLLNSFRRSSCGTEPLPLAGPEPEVKPRLPLTPHSRFPAAHRFRAVDFPPDPHGARATSGRAHFRLLRLPATPLPLCATRLSPSLPLLAPFVPPFLSPYWLPVSIAARDWLPSGHSRF